MSQNIADKADTAEVRTRETKGFMQQVRMAARGKYTLEEKVRIVLEGLFKQVVQICQKLGMVTLGLVAIDGTRVKTAASDYGAKTKDALREAAITEGKREE